MAESTLAPNIVERLRGWRDSDTARARPALNIMLDQAVAEIERLRRPPPSPAPQAGVLPVDLQILRGDLRLQAAVLRNCTNPDPVTAALLDRAAAALQPAPAADGWLKLPESATEAEAMQKLGYAWLEQHAPERLRTPQTGGEWRPPEGWRLVPVEATAELLKAMDKVNVQPTPGYWARVYAALLSAAPSPREEKDNG